MTKRIIAIGSILPLSLGNAIKGALIDNNYQNLVEQLELLINSKVTGIILYGSMATFNSQKIGESDIDLLVLVDEIATGGIFGQVENLEIDLHIQSRIDSLNDVVTNFIYSEGKVWYDLHPPELIDWLNRINMHMNENKNPWSEADELRHRVWAYRLVDKIIRISKIDPTLASLHEARLIANIPMLYKVSQRKYTTSIGNWWRQLLKEDESLVNEITAYLSNKKFPPDGISLKKIVDRIFNM